jgi:patatin-like phospholipase/acyl hydrolase
MKSNKNVVILSLDGGGLRGLIPIQALKHLEEVSGRKTVDCFDLIAGTSTGALIACGLVTPDKKGGAKFTLKDIENTYLQRGKHIFEERNAFSKFFHTWVKGIFFPEFNPNGLDKELEHLFNNEGKVRLSDGLKPLLITAFDLNANRPEFFKTRYVHQIEGNTSKVPVYDRNRIVNEASNAYFYDICRATSAAPTYLPAYKFNFDNRSLLCVDGGVFMNNPSMAALVEMWKYFEYYRPGEKMEEENIYILSIGTGKSKRKSLEREKTAINYGGKKNWVKPITDIMMIGPNAAADYQTKEALTFNRFDQDGKIISTTINYLRINIDLHDQYTDMTDSSDRTRNYLLSEFQKQFFEKREGSHSQAEHLKEFLIKAGVM